MLRLRSCIILLSRLLSSPSASPVSPLHRLLSAAAAPRISPNPSFPVEEYLVSTCGLTPAQALKASAKLSHLKSPAKPDAVLAFLAGLGLSGADVADVVARDPNFLCASVERTLAPNVVGLTGLGLSRSEIARLFSIPSASRHLRRRSVVPKLQYYLPLFGSSENLLRMLKKNYYLVGANLERTVMPNVALLHECGLSKSDITKLLIHVPRMLHINPERFQTMVACAEGLGVPRGSGMFRQALQGVAFLSEEKIAAQVAYLKITFRWSDAEVGIAVSKTPHLLRRSKESLQRKSEFLISQVGLEPAYIVPRPAMLGYSLEGRLRPRYYVTKFLKENGLLSCDPNYYSVFQATEEEFMAKYICPHKEAAPHLSEDYDEACRGQVPTRFRFT